MGEPIIIILGAALGYLLGSIPFGLVFTRIGGRGDIRDIGSGNIGATNVLRSGSKVLALATLIADSVKGGLAVALIWRMGSDTAAYVAGLAAFIGHLFPVWLDFKGGKGVAVFIGAILIMSPLTGLMFLAVWVLVALVFRTSSLSAIIALILTVPFLAYSGRAIPQYSWRSWWRCPYGRIGKTLRGCAGTEPKIGR